jgi:hypothetical protein
MNIMNSASGHSCQGFSALCSTLMGKLQALCILQLPQPDDSEVFEILKQSDKLNPLKSAIPKPSTWRGWKEWVL